MKNEEIVKDMHRHISSGNLNYSQTYYTCETCGADIEDEDDLTCSDCSDKKCKYRDVYDTACQHIKRGEPK